MSMLKLLEQRQVEAKYNLSKDEIKTLAGSYSADFAATVMVERGHTNDEIKEATGINGCRLSWIRVQYKEPHPKADLEFAYREINKDFVRVVTAEQELFCKLFRCGHYHPRYEPVLKMEKIK